MTDVHPTAIVHAAARLEDGVTVGPFTVIGEHVSIGKQTTVASHVVIEGWTEIGEGCRIFPFASIGTIPQDLKFAGEESTLTIGNYNTIREFVTMNRGTAGGGAKTIIGDHNLFMAYAHVAHDCRIGSHTILANAATLAGHIQVGDGAIIGGLVGIHQFVRIGAYAMIGGGSAVVQDIPPFTSAAGNRAKLFGLNTVGLKRNGFTEERIENLKQAYKILFRSKLKMRDAVKRVYEEISDSEDAIFFARFIEQSERGVAR